MSLITDVNNVPLCSADGSLLVNHPTNTQIITEGCMFFGDWKQNLTLDSGYITQWADSLGSGLAMTPPTVAARPKYSEEGISFESSQSLQITLSGVPKAMFVVAKTLVKGDFYIGYSTYYVGIRLVDYYGACSLFNVGDVGYFGYYLNNLTKSNTYVSMNGKFAAIHSISEYISKNSTKSITMGASNGKHIITNVAFYNRVLSESEAIQNVKAMMTLNSIS